MTPPAPFPWFGGKRKVAPLVWEKLGDVTNYVEPFSGSAAVLLARPDSHEWWNRLESINDTDGLLVNWWRSVAAEPDTVARVASWPVTEADLTARHLEFATRKEEFAATLTKDPRFYDPVIAGWWVWGISAWLGGDWCTGMGPHIPDSVEGKPFSRGGDVPGVYKKIPMMSGSHGGKGIHKPIRNMTVLPEGVPDVDAAHIARNEEMFAALSNRLRRVRVACGDWSRLVGNPAKPAKGHITGVLLDPPYDSELRRGDLYANGDNKKRSTSNPHAEAREWALSKTGDPSYRIAYCSYSTETEDAMFDQAGWVAYRWTAHGGYGLAGNRQARENRGKEIIWFSPGCISVDTVREDTNPQDQLFSDMEGER